MALYVHNWLDDGAKRLDNVDEKKAYRAVADLQTVQRRTILFGNRNHNERFLRNGNRFEPGAN